MAKQVTTQSGLNFSTLAEARKHFRKLREDTSLGTRLSEPERSDVLDIYKRYCTTAEHPVVDAIDVTTAWDKELRRNGIYAQTKAFAVVTASGLTNTFSMDKALGAIAKSPTVLSIQQP